MYLYIYIKESIPLATKHEKSLVFRILIPKLANLKLFSSNEKYEAEVNFKDKYLL